MYQIRHIHIFSDSQSSNKAACAVARSDACPLGMQTVVGSILTSGNILSWRFNGHEIISMAILSLPLIQKGQNFVSYWQKNVH